MKRFLKKKHPIAPLFLLCAALQVADPSFAATEGCHLVQNEKLAVPAKGGAEAHRSGAADDLCPEVRRAELQQEAILLRTEAQGFVDHGALSALHLRQQEIQKELRELR